MSNDVGVYTFDNLLAGELEVTEGGIVVSGAGSLARGTVLGKITASGKLAVCNTAGTDDGRRTPYAILLEAVDATSADKPCAVALAGTFNSAALVFGGTDTIATHRVGLRDVGIYVKTNQPAVNA